ncbi:MAG: tRNA (N(6)-L-threonylcarbamoyladenosine(37)-C(2))-methylthiotransferase [Candidatus Diapherotrites archaeon]|uniref:tRNA-t(6)A37 methylthiotransferase n=1 Tax=Candidatus Iainarchaeum sp. TaxID=3101447 RepID=A0A8T3YJW4_9ARCH|nr:tRNA (N(6)-L-threonylcarbamoyladenosine(37)-C(2))-methylthiotransferase [Candidatus Diapherotrites archaeon]
MKIYVEGYGCSMNLAETESVLGHAAKNGFEISAKPEDADFLVINTCAVKEQTEFRMLSRIKRLGEIADANGSQLVVFGCLPKVNRKLVESVARNAIQMGPDLEALSAVLGISGEQFSPSIEPLRSNPFVSIIPICSGCTNYCTFCGTKLARGNIRSYPIHQIRRRIESELPGIREFWLTGQDTGAYGLDSKSSLPELLASLLEIEGDFRIRIGMMNPHHLGRIYHRLVPLFSDTRLYRFIHMPLQAGSDRILKLMRRGYTVSRYREMEEMLRRDVPGITIATDIIVGFPGETEKEFLETLSVVKETAPDITNISRFGVRPGTLAAGMPGRLSGSGKKSRSRRLFPVCRFVSLQRNKPMLGVRERIYVSEKGVRGGFMGRSSNYKPVIINEDCRGSFVEVEVTAVTATYLEGRAIQPQFSGQVLINRAHGDKAFSALKVRGMDL